MVVARHDDAGMKFFRLGANALVIGGDGDAGQVPRLRSSLPDVLQHGFSADRDEGFPRKSGGGVPRGDYAKNAERHTRF